MLFRSKANARIASAEKGGDRPAVVRERLPSVAASRVPIDFFVIAVISFVAGLIAAPWVIPDTLVFFYQPATLALVHTFALGWITAMVMGVMYRYAPALARRPLPYPRLAMPQLVLFVIGASGMVTHFALGSWAGVWSAAIVVILSAILFAVNICGCLWARLGDGVAETGMVMASAFLIVAGSLGFILALDKSYGFLAGNVITNLASHAHLAALGWVTLTICAVSYRMLPAFLLPRKALPRTAIYQLYALALTTLFLAGVLLLGTRGLILFAAAVVIALLAYLISVARLVATRRMRLDWSMRHALAGLLSLIVAIVLGLILSWIGTASEVGARLAAVYGLAALMGFFSNFIIGMSYQLFPGFVARVRTFRRWPTMAVATLGFRGPRWLVFTGFNGGLVLLAIGLISASVTLSVAGTLACAAGGIVYAVGTLRTLSYAYRAGRATAAAAAAD